MKFELPARGQIPTLSLSKKLPKKAEALLIPVFKGEDGLEIAATGILDNDVDILDQLTTVGATGKSGEITKIPGTEELPMIVAVGLGDSSDFDAEQLRRAAGIAARAMSGSGKIATTLGAFGMADAALGFILGAYDYRGLKTSDASAKASVAEIVFISEKDKKSELDEAVVIAESVCLARDLVNAPSSHLFPESYAAITEALATEHGIEVEILDDAKLAKKGFGGIVGVGQGSTRGPRLVRLTYTAAKKAKNVALVGKGVTFDTGGISLKPGANMDHMISDMGGSAAVIGSVIAAARLGLGVNVTATVPMAENMPGGNSYRPGDILTQYGGKTVEILNTDAEGRLILADAIVRACEDKPDYLIEMATLTGAQLVALGARTNGIMGSEEFRDRIAEIGRNVGEPAWSMPIPEEVAEEMKATTVADLRNIGTTRFGGMMQAGAFLSEFVADDIEWAHIDIAGPAFNTAGTFGYVPKRGTGNPVRTIVATLQDIAAQG